MSKSYTTYVKTIDIMDALKKGALESKDSDNEKKSKRDEYSILDSEAVTYRNTAEIAELHLATNLPPKSLVAFRPERAAWHETIVSISTRIQVEDEADMHIKVMQLYEQALPRIEKAAAILEEQRKSIQEQVRDLLASPVKKTSLTAAQTSEVLDFYEKLKAKSPKLGAYVKGYTLEKATIAYFTDKIYSEYANKAMMQLMEGELEAAIQGKKLKAIEMPKPDKRSLFMVAGGPASGKGSSVGMLMKTAQEQGIDWLNVVKTNGDSYKPLLMEPGTTNPLIYSQLVQEEAGIVKQAVQTRLELMTKANMTPHVFVDQTAVGKDRLDMTLKSGGRAYVVIVSTEAADAVERSYARGEAAGDKGRFEHTEMLLNVHRQTTIDSSKRMEECIGKDVILQIMDNNVEKGQQPTVVMSADFLKKTVIIHDLGKLERFLQKTGINTKAQRKEEFYGSKPMSIEEYLAPLINKMDITDKNGKILFREAPSAEVAKGFNR